jgi:hypothetical protein
MQEIDGFFRQPVVLDAGGKLQRLLGAWLRGGAGSREQGK